MKEETTTPPPTPNRLQADKYASASRPKPLRHADPIVVPGQPWKLGV